MTHTDKDIVAELHDIIQSAIGSDRYEVWFRGQVKFLWANDTGILEIQLSDEFSLEQVRRRFSVTIQAACSQLFSSPIQLQWKAVPQVKSLPTDARSTETSPSGDSTAEVRPTVAQHLDGQKQPTMRVVGTNGDTQLSLHAALDTSALDTSALDTSAVETSAVETPALGDGRRTQPRESTRRHSTIEAQSSVSQAAQTVSKLANSHPADAIAANRMRSAPQRRGEFDSFISGDQSALALSAAKHTVHHLGEISPLFLYGPTGVGKTHLLQSIYSAVRRRSRARCVLLSAEQFTSSFLEALRGHGLPSFRRKYRHIDLLLLDDIQFFVGKRATLVELLYTLDALVQDGHQVVLAADRPPNELSGVGTEIIARLSAGLICGLEYPEGEAKVQLVQRLAQERSIPLAPEVATLLAEELPGDARRIKGAVNRLAVIARALGEPPTVERARRELADLFLANQRPLAIPDIERAVCEVFGVEGKLLRSDRKTKTISQPRMLAMWLARKHTRAAFSEIGDYFGGRSHSTVISAHHKVERWVGSNSDIQVASGESKVCDAIRRIELNLRAM